MRKQLIYSFIILVLTISILGCQRFNPKTKKYNILFITIDDMRPQLGCYGDPVAITPNIDKIASQGLLFNRAYCQQAICGPSRTSILTGLYPNNTQVYGNHTHFRENVPNTITLPQLFKNNGYITTGLYKVFHVAGFDPEALPQDNLNDTASWSIPRWLPEKPVWGPYGDSIYQINKKKCLAKGKITYSNIPRSLAYNDPDVKDEMLATGETRQKTIEYLQQFKKSEKPFFLGVGFYKPHLPFIAPKKYWEMYNRNNIQLPENQYAPKGVPAKFLPRSGNVRSYVNIPDSGEFSRELKKNLLHGYLACISFVDAQVGLIMQELEKLGLKKKTIVVVMGDHGYQIGKHNLWCKKHTNFESATRTPLIISVPGYSESGKKVSSLVEFVDIYPTLAELCGVDAPEYLDGKSFKKLFENPQSTFRQNAFSWYGHSPGQQKAFRTEHFRFNQRAISDSTFYELYDHRKDPEENVNVAYKPEYDNVVASMKQIVNKKMKKIKKNSK